MDLAINSEIGYNCSPLLIIISLENNRISKPHDIFEYIAGIGPSSATDTSREIVLH